MKKLILISIVLSVIFGFILKANAKILVYGKLASKLNHWNLKCDTGDGVYLMGLAEGTSQNLTMQFGRMNAVFLNSIGVKTDIGYETLFYHTNIFICRYLKNNIKTKARIMLLTFSNRIFNHSVDANIFDQSLLKAYFNPKYKRITPIVDKDKILLKDLFIGNYNQAKRVIRSIPFLLAVKILLM
jgi:hypothetical protein